VGVSALCVSAGIDAPSAPVARSETQPGTHEPLPLVPPRAAKPSSFAARVGISAPEDDDDETGPIPVRGDLVEHFAFGLCEVLTATGERLVVRDLKGPGRIREIASDRLVIGGPTEHDGKRLYRLTKRG